jgi:hypothetical protein
MDKRWWDTGEPGKRVVVIDDGLSDSMSALNMQMTPAAGTVDSSY